MKTSNKILAAILGLIFFSGLVVMIFLKAEVNHMKRNLVQGNKQVIKKDTTLQAFQSIEVEGTIDVELRRDSVFGMTIEAESNIIPLFEAKVNEGKLIIRTKRGVGFNANTQPKIYLSLPGFNGLYLHGASTLTSRDSSWVLDDLDIEISGASDLNLWFSARDLDISVSGASEMSLGGQADKLDTDISGNATMKAFKLVCKQAEVEVNGVGELELHVTESLKANVSGNGDVAYKGSPKTVDQSVNGVGSVHKVD